MKSGNIIRAPMTRAQRRIWFLTELSGDPSLYNVASHRRIRGTIGVDALARATDDVVRRHTALRCRFVEGERGPVQESIAGELPALEVRDLGALPAQAREAELLSLNECISQHRFDFAKGGLLRCVLVRLGPDDHALFVTSHQLCMDGWSLALFWGELLALHEAHRTGAPIGAEAPGSYLDIAAAAPDKTREKAPESLAYWRARLAGAGELRLPSGMGTTKKARSSLSTVALDSSEWGDLSSTGRRYDCTPFVAALAVSSAAIGRCVQQRDFVVGVPVSGRDASNWNVIGLFTESIPVRVHPHSYHSFAEYLVQVRNSFWSDYAHAQLSFDEIVAGLAVKRDSSRNPIFQAMIAFEEFPPVSPVPGLRLEELPGVRTTARLDLLLEWQARPGGGMQCTLECDPNRIDSRFTERLGAAIRAGAHLLARTPTTPLAELRAVTDDEIRTERQAWRGKRVAIDLESRIEDRIARWTKDRPDAPAILCGTRALTYAELDRESEAIARDLRRLGVGVEDRVGVFLPRTPLLVATLLGVLKAGAAYVGIDSRLPPGRRDTVLKDAEAKILVSDPAEIAATHRELNVEVLGGRSASRGNKTQTSAHLAYLIYTSGSTGKPKGVGITHRNVLSLIDWAGQTYTEHELAGVLAATAITFDLSTFELLVVLALGGTLVLEQDLLAFAQSTNAEKVTLINTVPSAMQKLLALGKLPSSVRCVNLAGELLVQDLVDALLSQSEVRRVFDLYGPSETTTYSTCAARAAKGPQTIGWPIVNERVYILDEDYDPVPPGTIGTLFIAGEGVSRGYIGRAAATAERFLPDPFGNFAGDRMYCTGDLGRRRDDGSIEFLGRADRQVKISGFRIELDEIEAALRACEGVFEAVSFVEPNGDGTKRIVAAVVPRQETDMPDLRLHLLAILPHYAVPARIVATKAIPRLLSGKVDYTKLAEQLRNAPSAADPKPEKSRGFWEEKLAQIWCDVLGLGDVPLDRGFFELGGHSLLLTDVYVRLPAEVRSRVTLVDLFRYPTIEALGPLLEASARGSPREAETQAVVAQIQERLQRSRGAPRKRQP